MENASKALIIAGAILLSILIIALGMGVFNQAKEAMSGSGLSSEQIAAYNAKFEDYVGTRVKGSKAKALCDTIKNHNLAKDDEESYAITITYEFGTDKDATGKTEATDIDAIKAKIKSGKTYTITVGQYDTSGGYITKMNIKEN